MSIKNNGFKQRLYSPDVAILKDYGGITRKLTLHKVLRNKGVECDEKKYSPKCSVNDEKLQSNISRSKARVFEYAYCNEWELFITFTIDGKKHDRKDIKGYYKIFVQWLRDYGKKHKLNIKYLFIPELHEDGVNWHMHGFLMGLPLEHLRLLTLEDKLPYKLLEKIRGGDLVYTWDFYSDKFGWSTLEKIRDRKRCASYITKYISKDLSDCITELNSKMYYNSTGLQTAKEIKRGSLSSEFSNPDFENEWVKVKNYDDDLPLDILKNFIC